MTDKLRNALEDLDDFCRVGGIYPVGPYNVLKRHIEEYELMLVAYAQLMKFYDSNSLMELLVKMESHIVMLQEKLASLEKPIPLFSHAGRIG